MSDDQFHKLWQEQEGVTMTWTIEQLREKVAGFEKRIHRRNLPWYAAGGLALVVCIVFGARSHELTMRIGCLMLVPALTFVLVHLYRRSRVEFATSLSESGFGCYRRQLERQRELWKTYWSWYIAPTLPGLAVILIGGPIERGGHKEQWMRSMLLCLLAVGGLLAEWWMMRRRVNKVQREIEELDTIST